MEEQHRKCRCRAIYHRTHSMASRREVSSFAQRRRRVTGRSVTSSTSWSIVINRFRHWTATGERRASINPDAHSMRELNHMHWRIEMAKGGIPPTRVHERMNLPELTR